MEYGTWTCSWSLGQAVWMHVHRERKSNFKEGQWRPHIYICIYKISVGKDRIVTDQGNSGSM